MKKPTRTTPPRRPSQPDLTKVQGGAGKADLVNSIVDSAPAPTN